LVAAAATALVLCCGPSTLSSKVEDTPSEQPRAPASALLDEPQASREEPPSVAKPVIPQIPVAARNATGPGDWSAGDYPPALREQVYLEIRDVLGQQGLTRQYKVHVPPSYDPNLPTPLVFCFHGLGQNAVMFCVDGANMVAQADARGYLLVMPTGFGNSWNAGTCCGDASARALDDVALVRAILDEVGTHLNVDLDRVYATGFSNGGYLSLRLACDAADRVAAVAPASAAIGTNDRGGGTNPNSDFVRCAPSAAVSVLAIHGTQDSLVPYSMFPPSLAELARTNGCAATQNLATDLPNAGDTQCVSYDACAPGVEVTGCTVTGGGHVWFGDSSCGTGAGPFGCLFVGNNSSALVNTEEVWQFFERCSKNRSAVPSPT
jgi:polyhydroxybutyrate depolymerase